MLFLPTFLPKEALQHCHNPPPTSTCLCYSPTVATDLLLQQVTGLITASFLQPTCLCHNPSGTEKKTFL